MNDQDHLRAGNAEREAVVRQLNEAFSEGRLDVGELEERVSKAYAAKTLGDLRPLTADLPAAYRVEDPVAVAGPAPAPSPLEPGRSARPGRSGREVRRWDRRERALRRGTVASWLSASLVNLGIWAAVCVGSAHWVYPWWIWVAGPWGAVILAGEVARRVSR